MRLLSVLAAGSQQLAQRILVRTAPAFACALSGTIGMGFATYALFESMRLQYGVINALFELGISSSRGFTFSVIAAPDRDLSPMRSSRQNEGGSPTLRLLTRSCVQARRRRRSPWR